MAPNLTPAQEYAINDSLSEVFTNTASPAIRYGERNLKLARRLGDRDRSGFRSDPARPVLFVPRRLHRGPATARLGPPELPPQFSRTLLPDLYLLYECYEVFRLQLPTNNRRFTAIRSGGTSESRQTSPKTREQAEQRLLDRLAQIPPGTPSTPRPPIPWATTTGPTATTGWRKILHPLGDRRHPKRHERERCDTRWRSSTSDHKDYSRPTNTPSRPRRRPLQQHAVPNRPDDGALLDHHRLASGQRGKTKVKLQHYLI